MAVVEWDQNACETLRLNYPHVEVFQGDIAAVSVEDLLQRTGLKAGELDVFDGSPPCQGFSTAGSRQIDDPRNQLFREFVRLLRGLKPKAFVMENVSGMVKGHMRSVFVEIIKELKGCGYRVSARLLNAKYFNVPQSRERMIFIGVRDDLNREPSHPAGESIPITAGHALIGVRNDEKERQWLLEAGTKYAAYRDWKRIPIGFNLGDANGCVSGFSCVKVDPSRPAPTITKNAGELTMHAVNHWGEQRRFTKAEFMRLGSFPDDYKFAGEWADAVRRIGNSVPPLLMRSIARHIREELL